MTKVPDTGLTAAQAYELDRLARPFYPCGNPRPPWSQLSDLAKSSWEKNPTPRWMTEP